MIKDYEKKLEYVIKKEKEWKRENAKMKIENIKKNKKWNMKKFSSLKDEVKTKYELKDSLRNEIYSLVESSISIKISNENSLDKDIELIGKEELVEKIKILIDDIKVKERILTLETVKVNVHRNFDMKWLNEQISNLKKVEEKSNIILTEKIK